MRVEKVIVAGAYKITHTPSGKYYVGSSKNLEKRFREHRSKLKNGYHSNGPLQEAYNADGPDSLVYEHLEHCDSTLEELTACEQKWLDGLEAFNKDKGYNLCPNAYTNTGVKLSPEVCERMAARNRGRRASEETKARMRASSPRRKHSPEVLEKIRVSRIGHSWNKGCKWTEESCAARRMPVVQLNLDRQVIAEYACAQDAADATGCHQRTVAWACRSGYLADKYYWHYKGGPIPKEASARSVTKHCKVEQRTLTGELVTTWDNLRHVLAENANYKVANLSICLVGKNKSAYGFVWHYIKPTTNT